MYLIISQPGQQKAALSSYIIFGRGKHAVEQDNPIDTQLLAWRVRTGHTVLTTRPVGHPTGQLYYPGPCFQKCHKTLWLR